MQLHAKNDTERRLLEYLEANASPALREKIAALPDGDRFGLGAAWRHIEGEARKKLASRSGYLADEVVFGWLVHYYEDVAPAEAAKAPTSCGFKCVETPHDARLSVLVHDLRDGRGVDLVERLE